MQIGQAIKRIRKEQSLQGNDLAEMVGVSPIAVWKMENKKGDFRLSSITKYATALGLRPSELVRIAEETL